MAQISIIDADRIKRVVASRLHIALHIHDTCGSGLFFTVDSADPRLTAFFKTYAKMENLKLFVNEDETLFSLEND
ncbi:MAG: hypothetical protein ACI39G_05870 [Pseudoramibacter sp.]